MFFFPLDFFSCAPYSVFFFAFAFSSSWTLALMSISPSHHDPRASSHLSLPLLRTWSLSSSRYTRRAILLDCLLALLALASYERTCSPRTLVGSRSRSLTPGVYPLGVGGRAWRPLRISLGATGDVIGTRCVVNPRDTSDALLSRSAPFVELGAASLVPARAQILRRQGPVILGTQ